MCRLKVWVRALVVMLIEDDYLNKWVFSNKELNPYSRFIQKLMIYRKVNKSHTLCGTLSFVPFPQDFSTGSL
jgi:hypothetical protein